MNEIAIKTNHQIDKTPPAPPKEIHTFEGVGMAAAMMAVMDAIPIFQKNSGDGVMGLAASIAEYQTDQAVKAQQMMNEVEEEIQKEMKSSDPQVEKSAKINELNQEFRKDNTEYDQRNAFWQSLSNGLNEDAANMNQTIKTLLSLYAKGPENQMKNLTQILG